MREVNTLLLIAGGVFLLWLGVTGKIKNVAPAWKMLLTGTGA